jgi:hypothetical protein
MTHGGRGVVAPQAEPVADRVTEHIAHELVQEAAGDAQVDLRGQPELLPHPAAARSGIHSGQDG